MDKTDCQHENIKPTLHAETSLMHIAFFLYGFKCEDCGKQWDIGNVVEIIQKTTELESTISGYEAVMKEREKLDDLAK